MSIFFFLLILVWSQISGSYAIALLIVGKNENISTISSELCRTCYCEPTTKNCNEEICTDPKSIHTCKNKTYQANTELQAKATTSPYSIGFIFKMLICMFVMYMFIIHASGNCFDSSPVRRTHSGLNQIPSDNGLPSVNSVDRSCVMPLNVYLGYNNIVNDPPPSYNDVQIARTHVVSPGCATQPPVQSSDLNDVELNTFNNYSARLFLTSMHDEPPPSYDEYMAIRGSKPSRVHSLPLNYANDHLYTAIPVDAIETPRDSQAAFET